MLVLKSGNPLSLLHAPTPTLVPVGFHMETQAQETLLY